MTYDRLGFRAFGLSFRFRARGSQDNGDLHLPILKSSDPTLQP